MAAKGTTTKSGSKVKTEYVTRFNLRQRIEHIVLMVLFTLLSFTGIIQLFWDNSVGSAVIMGLGGIETTRLIHRAIGVTFTLVMLYHAAYLLYAVVVRKQKPTIMPNIQDFQDVVAEIKLAIGLKAEKPQFRRFDYKQKFEYIGLVFGSVVLIVTGVVLMFPGVVTAVLPGQLVAVAARFHGYEATLAVLTILIWHLYSVVLRPGIFPADTSIFTGRISKERMVEEHALEYEEIKRAQ